jgi:hypothetical protein
MNSAQRAIIIALAAIGFSFTVLPTAGAYLDPGTGSMVIQFVVGAVATVGIVIATFWRKITGLFGRGTKSDETINH